MKRLSMFMMAACLFADGQVDKECEFNIQYVVGQFVVLTNDTVFKGDKADEAKLLDLGETARVHYQGDESFLVDNERHLKIKCEEIGQIKAPLANVVQIFPGAEEDRDMVIELSDGDLYIVPNDSSTVWKLGANVLKVETESGMHILDFSDGSFDFVARFGSVELDTISDIITANSAGVLTLESLGNISLSSSIFGSFGNWAEGDQVTVQKFSDMHFPTLYENASYLFLHNVTQEKLAVGYTK